MASASATGMGPDDNFVDLDTSMFLANPVFACEALPGLPNYLSRPIEDRDAIDKRIRERRALDAARNARYISETLFIPENDDTMSVDGSLDGQFHDTDAINGENGSRIKRSASTTSLLDQKDRKMARIEGGRPAIPKRVTAILDAEDATIWDMKTAGYKDEVIAKRLINDGGTRYDPKTIATRFSRIKRAIYNAEQIRLEDEFSDFHEDEDNHLVDAHEETDAWFARELKSLQVNRWKMIAENVKTRLGKHKYSTEACRNRYDDLVTGTGVKPQELDADPRARAAEAKIKAAERVEARRAAKQKLRLEEEARHAARVEEHRAKEEKRAIVERERAAKDAEKAAVAAERQRIADAKSAIKQAARQKKKAEDDIIATQKAKLQKEAKDIKAAAAWSAQMKKTEAEGREIERKLEAAKAQMEALETERKMLEESTFVKALIRRSMRDAGTATIAPMPAVSTPGSLGASKAGRYTYNNAREEYEDDESVKASPKPKASIMLPPQTTNPAAVRTANLAKELTNNSPRNSMTITALRTVAKSRSLSVLGTKEDLVARLAKADAEMCTEQLDNEMVARGLEEGGSKMQRARRIATHDATTTGQKGGHGAYRG